MRNDGYLFINSLEALLEGGCTVREALEILDEETGYGGIRMAARYMLDRIKDGESLASAFTGSGIIRERSWKDCAVQFEQTGNLRAALRLMLDGMERRGENARQLAQALAYPLAVLALTFSLVLALFLFGIPLLRDSGLACGPETLGSMRRGVAGALVFLAVTTATAGGGGYRVLSGQQRLAGFWSTLESLSAAGLTFEQCLSVCRSSGNLPYPIGPAVDLADWPDLGVYERSVLLTASHTGDYPASFGMIARWHRRKEASMLALAGRLAEPALMCVAGIVIVILCVTVFLPVLNLAYGSFDSTGGFR